MTIVCAVKVRDGLVLGTDSMTQIQAPPDPSGNTGVIKTFSNARKLFQIKRWPIGVMTFGLGNIGQRSIQGLVIEFGHTYAGDKGVQTVAASFFDFMKGKYNELFEHAEAEKKPVLGFYVAGYSPNAHFPEEWEFMLPIDQGIHAVRPMEEFGSSWRGIDIPFARLYMGFDPRAFPELKKRGASDEIIAYLSQAWQLPIVYDGMPVQDSINFATFILNTTIGISSFEIGVPSCGGPLQVATILPQSGFSWIAEPKLVISSTY